MSPVGPRRPPLLPPEPPKPKGGRPRVSDRAALTGIVFVLNIGIPWELLPPEMGCGSGMTCRRCLRDWQEAGVWDSAAPDAALIGWVRPIASTGAAPLLDSCEYSRPEGGRPRRSESDGSRANRARSAMLWSTAPGSRLPPS